MSDEAIVIKAIQSVQQSLVAFCKFITANDTGDTGAHQAGYHIHKSAWPLMFDSPGVKGSNKEHFITIQWNEEFQTDSRFIYYGVGTRNEYRLTRFGKNFPHLISESVGSLLILTKQGPDDFDAFVLYTDDEMEEFFEAVGISIADTNKIIPRPTQQTVSQTLQDLFNGYISQTEVDFPETTVMSDKARSFYNQLNRISESLIFRSADKYITEWIETEYALFKSFEASRYQSFLTTPLGDMDKLVEVANTVLQRRKSRAGKSLEHHLAYIFNLHSLQFERNAITENNKKPDFLFPSQDAYHNIHFPTDNLIVLGAKTTCKDRWRQVVSEANRCEVKYLCTLQQGNTANQLTEMYDNGIRLVVPNQYVSAYPQAHRKNIMSIDKFIQTVKSKQST